MELSSNQPGERGSKLKSPLDKSCRLLIGPLYAVIPFNDIPIVLVRSGIALPDKDYELRLSVRDGQTDMNCYWTDWRGDAA